MAKVTTLYKQSEDKKHSIIYKPADSDPPLKPEEVIATSIYVMRAALPVIPPKTLKITAEWED